MKKAPTLAASSFVAVADLRPASPTIVVMTPVYIPVPGEDDAARDHRVAVLFDEDEDERGIDVLTAILYRAPHTFSKIAAVYERKGHVTVWTQETTHVDRTVIETAATDSTVLRGDRWSVEVREIFCGWSGEQPTLKVTEYSEAREALRQMGGRITPRQHMEHGERLALRPDQDARREGNRGWDVAG